MEKMNFCKALCTLVEYVRQFEENSFVMRPFYQTILVQYNEHCESDVERQISIQAIYLSDLKKAIFGKKKEGLINVTFESSIEHIFSHKIVQIYNIWFRMCLVQTINHSLLLYGNIIR